MNRLSTLWHLQVIDQELDDKTARARQVDDALSNDPKVAAARVALEAEQKELSEARGMLRDRELDAGGLDAKATEIEGRLYGGSVSNPKELDGLAKDLQMHKRLRSELDDKMLALMDSVEQAQQRVDERARAFKQIEATRAGDLERLARERETLIARLAALQAERGQTRAALDANALREYDQLRRTKAGCAVAQVKRDSCGACGVTVPTGLVQRVRAGDELVLCTSCGRILAS
ncbi:MAG: hypothetical protein KGJ80_03250 [Chloroflexota bacterium]|nr:hypothetical protein [Chloroflexota bacterium]